jgi:replication-associated recombination protein RarA
MKYLKLYKQFRLNESSHQNKKTIFLFGPQGVGKTTICKLLSSQLNMKIIE